MERFHKTIPINCFTSPFRTMWNVRTILARIHSAVGPVERPESTLKWLVVPHKLLLHVRLRLFIANGSDCFHTELKLHPWKPFQIQLKFHSKFNCPFDGPSLCVTHEGHRCTLQWTRWNSWLHSGIDCLCLLTSSLIRVFNERPCARTNLELHALHVKENSLLRSCATLNAIDTDYNIIDNAENCNISEE